jgi:uncharacterized membrane protein
VTSRTVARGFLGVLFIAAGINHFVDPATYLRMMPPYLPFPLALVYLSGVAEVGGGIGVFSTRWRTAAGWALIALLVAVFPANVHMALHPELFPNITPMLLWGRLPLQLVLIAWVWWVTRPAAAQGFSASSTS